MCGIVGYMTRSGYIRHKDYFVQALYADGLRGLDATGVFMVNEHTGNVSVVKRAMAVNDFLDLKIVDNAFKSLTSCSIAVGHNRQATAGAHTHANAHPFTHGEFTLVHNGTLRTTYDLPDNKMFDVDSEMVCYSFSKIGIEETLKKINGAFALVWYDSKRKVLQMVRNDERPLWVGTNEEGSEIFFASEGGLVNWMCGRQNPSIKLKSLELLKPGVIHTFSYSEDKTAKEIIRHEQEVKLWEPYVYTPPTNPNAAGHALAKPEDVPATGERTFIGKELSKLGLAYNQKISVIWTGKMVTSSMQTTRYEGYMTEEPWLSVTFYTQIDPNLKIDEEYRTKIIGCTKMDNATGLIVSKEHMRKVRNNPIVLPAQYQKLDDDDEETRAGIISLHVKGPNGKQISRGRFLELTKHGCSNCTKSLSTADQEDIVWLSGDNPLCPECTEELSGMLNVQRH